MREESASGKSRDLFLTLFLALFNLKAFLLKDFVINGSFQPLFSQVPYFNKVSSRAKAYITGRFFKNNFLNIKCLLLHSGELY